MKMKLNQATTGARRVTGVNGRRVCRAAVCRLLALGAVVGTLLATSSTSSAEPTPWAVIKCKFSDQPQDPNFDPAFIAGPNGLAAYWRDVSYGHITWDG